MILKVFTKAVIGFFLGVVAYVVLLVVWWQVYPYRTATIMEPITVLNENKVVKKGEKLNLEFTFTKHTNVTPTVSRNIYCENGAVYFPVVDTPITGAARPAGTFTVRSSYGLTTDMPLNTDCVFQFTNEYRVNPVRTITKVWKSENFTIVE